MEQKEWGDIQIVEVEENYGRLTQKLFAFLSFGCSSFSFSFFMHADDDSYVRVEYLIAELQKQPTKNLYYGYLWDNIHTRITTPNRNPTSKSYIPLDHYPLPSFPPFCSGCGFVLSYDLAEYLERNHEKFREVRVIDVAVGVYLFPLNISPIHEDRIRPYRPLPLFRSDTIIQHYLQPEEFLPFHKRATGQVQDDYHLDKNIIAFFNSVTSMGLIRK